MGLPSKRRTPRSKHERASHFGIKTKSLTTCANCGKAMLPHRACPNCGMYREKQVLSTQKRAERSRKRAAKK